LEKKPSNGCSSASSMYTINSVNVKRFVQNYIRPCVRICGLLVRMSPCRLCVCLFLHVLAHRWVSPAKVDEPIILGDGNRLQGRVHAGAGGAQAPKSWLGPEILPAPKLWLAVVLCLSVCLCLFISHKSVFCWSGWTDRAGFWHGASLDQSHAHLFLRKFRYSQNKGTSLWNFFLNSKLTKVYHRISIVERAVNLAWEMWTLRAW